MNGRNDALHRWHDQLGAMIDQVGQPDYSLREMVDGLRQIRDEMLQSTSAPQSETPRGDTAKEAERISYRIGYVDGNRGATPQIPLSEGELAVLRSNGGSAKADDDSDCATCEGDPEVCAKVPGLRHCEKAMRSIDGAAKREGQDG